MDIRVTLTSATTRTTVVVEETKTVSEILEANNFAAQGQTFHLNGLPLDTDEMHQPIGELCESDEAIIVAVPAQKAGR